MAIAAVVGLLALFSALSIVLSPEESSDPRDQLPIWARIGLR